MADGSNDLVNKFSMLVIGGAVAFFMMLLGDWITAPGMREFKQEMETNSPWVRDKPLVTIRLDAINSAIGELKAKVDSVEKESRINSSNLERFRIRLELEDTKKK